MSMRLEYQPEMYLTRHCSDFVQKGWVPHYKDFFTKIAKRLKLLRWMLIMGVVKEYQKHSFRTEVICLEQAVMKHYGAIAGPFYFHRKSKKSLAIGYLMKEGFMVSAWSRGTLKAEKSLRPTMVEFRNKIIENPAFAFNNGEYFYLRENILFDNPTKAAAFIVGSSVSGPQAWKMKGGASLKKVIEARASSPKNFTQS